MLIFDHSRPGRRAGARAPLKRAATGRLPERFRRTRRPALPKVSKLQLVRHYTRLSRKSFSIDTHFYPLGSCTMRYNPHASDQFAMLSGFLHHHPYAPEHLSHRFMSCLYDL